MIEDDDVFRSAVCDLLEMSGYAVSTAIHGADALEKLRAGAALPSLIMLDLNMPVMAGREFIEKLRMESEEHSRIPIVVISALPDVSLTGVAAVLNKPVGMKAILEQVRLHGRG